MRRIKRLAKRSSTADNVSYFLVNCLIVFCHVVQDYQDSGSESQFKEKFSRVMNQLVSSNKSPKNRCGVLCRLILIVISCVCLFFVYENIYNITILFDGSSPKNYSFAVTTMHVYIEVQKLYYRYKHV